jgi:hypothetical protein
MKLLSVLVLILCGMAGAYAGSPGNASSPSTYTDAVDGSASVALDAEHFAAASDEDSTLRVYCRSHGGPPVRSIDLTQFLDVPAASPETDLEAAARIGDRAYWTSSHGRNSRGKEREARYRFFATDITTDEQGVNLVPVGRPYRDLLRDLIEEKQLEPFQLEEAAARAPKSAGGLSIEGLSATPDGHLLIGFRNPVPQGRALLVPLLNPDAVVQGNRARFGPPIRLDLGGLGIRDMAFWEGEYLIIAGPFDGKGQSRPYRWAGGDASPRMLDRISLKGFNAEAIVIYPDYGLRQVQLLSDDGSEGTPRLGQKQFRSIWVSP